MLTVLALAAFAALPQASEAQYYGYGPGIWQYRAYRPFFGWRRAYATTVYRPFVGTRTAYRPVVATSACSTCSPCATSQCATTVRYAPQTCYRPQVVSVPTVTYRPVQSCDACTGCCQTVMRPVTTYVRQVRQVAYTTYRPVYSTSCSTPCTTCASPCSSCGVVGCSTCSTTSSCATGQCGVESTIYSEPTTSTPSAEPETRQPSLLENSQRTEAQKIPTENSELSPEKASGDMQEVDGARLKNFDPPALLNPRDRQARVSNVRQASYHLEVEPELPVQWQAVD